MLAGVHLAFATEPQPSSSASAPAPTATAPKKEIAPLPKERLVMVYKNGDLDSVIFYLKQGRSKPMFQDKSDSILAFKYLGLIYSADPDHREKGRYYFNQLLRLDPQASITELLPGEQARGIFKEVREEFFELNPGLAPKAQPSQAASVASAQDPAASADGSSASPSSASQTKIGPRKSSHLLWWIGGGVLVAGAAAATVVAIEDGPVKTYQLHD